MAKRTVALYNDRCKHKSNATVPVQYTNNSSLQVCKFLTLIKFHVNVTHSLLLGSFLTQVIQSKRTKLNERHDLLKLEMLKIMQSTIPLNLVSKSLTVPGALRLVEGERSYPNLK